MKSLRAVLDFEAETISIDGSEPQPLQKNSAGQFILNVKLFCVKKKAQSAWSPKNPRWNWLRDVNECSPRRNSVASYSTSGGMEQRTKFSGTG